MPSTAPSPTDDARRRSVNEYKLPDVGEGLTEAEICARYAEVY